MYFHFWCALHTDPVFWVMPHRISVFLLQRDDFSASFRSGIKCYANSFKPNLLALDCNRELDVTVDLGQASRGHSSPVLKLWRDVPACSGARLSPGEMV